MLYYPTYDVDGFTIVSKVTHIGKRIHGVNGKTTRSFYHDLFFSSPDIDSEIKVSMGLRLTQVFQNISFQNEYYIGNRSKVNQEHSPLYFIDFLNIQNYLSNNDWIDNFIFKGIQKHYEIDETQFHQGVKNGYWFFLDNRYVSEATEVVDAHQLYGIQINYRQNIENNDIIIPHEIVNKLRSMYTIQGVSVIDGPTDWNPKEEDYVKIVVPGSRPGLVQKLMGALLEMGLVDVHAFVDYNGSFSMQQV